ncbi:tetratricopeptide repeat protein [Flavisolibacter ginsenosidimutans]|nr:tetratricopeptide repeat protein [Flavisolibacter ginsenosidimutans]
MNRPQWITLSVAILLVIGLFAATQASIFGERKAKKPQPAMAEHLPHDDGFGTDSVLYYAKKNLPQAQAARLASLENSVVRGDVAEQKLHLMHQLARYWSDSGRTFTPMAFYPYAFYTAEAARLENSEKSLSFAARLFLDALSNEEAHQLKHWEAEQAQDLFQRSLKLNPENDSAKVGLGATILYGGLDMPMKGIGMIRDVAEHKPENVYAQLTLAEASLMSGQLDKAVERLQNVLRLQPSSLQATLLLADTYERMNKKKEAAEAYQKALPLVTVPEMKKEIEKRITQLKNK